MLCQARSAFSAWPAAIAGRSVHDLSVPSGVLSGSKDTGRAQARPCSFFRASGARGGQGGRGAKLATDAKFIMLRGAVSASRVQDLYLYRVVGHVIFARTRTEHVQL